MPKINLKDLNTKQSLNRLKVLMAEQGYQIFTPALRFQRSAEDFIAIDREFGHLYLFRFGKNGVEVRRRNDPLASKSNIIRDMRKNISSNLRQRHFMPAVDFEDWWKWVVPDEYEGFQEALNQRAQSKRRKR